MRHHRIDETHHRLDALAQHRRRQRGALVLEKIGQFADPRDRTIETELVEIVRHRGNGAMDRTPRRIIARRRRATRRQRAVGGQPPQPVDVTPNAFDAGVGPFEIALGRAVRQEIEPRGIGAVALGDGFEADHVLLRLRHLFAAADGDSVRHRAVRPAGHLFGEQPVAGPVPIGLVADHALREQAGERLGRSK